MASVGVVGTAASPPNMATAARCQYQVQRAVAERMQRERRGRLMRGVQRMWRQQLTIQVRRTCTHLTLHNPSCPLPWGAPACRRLQMDRQTLHSSSSSSSSRASMASSRYCQSMPALHRQLCHQHNPPQKRQSRSWLQCLRPFLGPWLRFRSRAKSVPLTTRKTCAR